MSAISLILLAAAALATALGGAALHTARGLNRRLDELRAQLATAEEARDATAAAATVPAARSTPAEEIRSAVAEALAEERERELAEARAFWAAQEARDPGADGGPLLAGHGTEYEIAPDLDHALLEALLEGRLDGLEGLPDLDVPPRDRLGPSGTGTPGTGPSDTGIFVPRQPGREDAEEPSSGPQHGTNGADTAAGSAADEATGTTARRGTEGEPPPYLGHGLPADPAPGRENSAGRPVPGQGRGPEHPEPESAELAAARRRHPSQRDFTLDGDPAPSPVPAAGRATLAEHERTVRRLSELADARTPLADVRPGPLGTLDVYAFTDGTTMCLSPGHQETAQRLADAVHAGRAPVLLGGSSIAGAYALTFAIGEQQIYTLADRVIASR